ncbi:poly-beta-1,6-N-acetyl-D-glucosamine biosynthesis protein PgaD [Aquimonas voraii]|uniref:Biofilm PGA synthesis protein PgaD n=1 Tax=Aquimonas voraii TaxID=265719 RepID=A0A1G6Y1M4_9GAMM|nr:poly-beta-1,6-N-acetyl-D-glucosamine biosynthesis protein PgaD [Aquimonas voraii]SDD84192.1 biofilm PGA synthesis protein PgaD [Aquimonas voraii]
METLNPAAQIAASAHQAKPSGPLIVVPEKVSWRQRTLSHLLTSAAWAAYFWLIAPLLTTLAWALGLRYAWLELTAPLLTGDGMPGLLLPILGGGGVAVLLLWAEFNRWRFTGVERRKTTPPVSDAVVAAALGAPLSLPHELRTSFETLPVVVLQMNEQAEPEGFVATLEPPKPLRRVMK